VTLSVMPIGIDRGRVEDFLGTPAYETALAQYRAEFKDLRVVVGYDRIDPVKGLLQKLEIFGELLESRPDLRGRVVLVQVAVPTEDQAFAAQLSRAVGEINAAHGSVAYTPVHLHAGAITWEEQLALFTIAEVLLVTSIRDGMNLTPAEYVLCQGEGGSGSVVISEFAGTAESLAGAVRINPWDYVGSARALGAAVDSAGSAAAEAKMRDMHGYVTTHSATAWGARFIQELRRAGRHYRSTLQALAPLRTDQVVAAYAAARERVLLLDYDGTLTAIQSLPELAVPPAALLPTLRRLATEDASGGTHVYVVSGRDKASLTGFLGELPIGLSAEHGGHLRRAGDPEWVSYLATLDLAWMRPVREVLDFFTERTPGSHVEVKAAALCWHYRNAEETHAQWQANELRNHLEETVVGKFPVSVLIGKKTVEVRPAGIDKGTVVTKILALHPKADFIFCVGDDRTDEDMFRVVREAARGGGNLGAEAEGAAAAKAAVVGKAARAGGGVAAHTVMVGNKTVPSASAYLDDIAGVASLLEGFAAVTARAE
jgi:trehalose 6-phosphate synthase/phosphatase